MTPARTNGSRWSGRRLLGLCGLAAVALTLPAFVAVPPLPAVGASAADIGAYFGRHGTAFLVFGWLLALSVPLMLVHVSAVAWWMSGQSGLPGWLWLLYAGAGWLAHGVQLVLLAVFQVLGMRAARGSAGETVTLLWLGNVGFAFYAVVEMVPLAVATIVIWRTRAVWRGLAVLPAAGVLLCLIGSLATVDGSGITAGGIPAVAWYLLFIAAFGAVNLALVVGPTARDTP